MSLGAEEEKAISAPAVALLEWTTLSSVGTAKTMHGPPMDFGGALEMPAPEE